MTTRGPLLYAIAGRAADPATGACPRRRRGRVRRAAGAVLCAGGGGLDAGGTRGDPGIVDDADGRRHRGNAAPARSPAPWSAGSIRWRAVPIRPRWVFGTLAVLAIAMLALVPQLTRSEPILPALQDRDLLIHWQAAPGTSLTEMTRITDAAAAELRGISGVGEVGSHLGRAVMADQSGNVNSGEMWVSLADSADYQATVNDDQAGGAWLSGPAQ